MFCTLVHELISRLVNGFFLVQKRGIFFANLYHNGDRYTSIGMRFYCIWISIFCLCNKLRNIAFLFNLVYINRIKNLRTIIKTAQIAKKWHNWNLSPIDISNNFSVSLCFSFFVWNNLQTKWMGLAHSLIIRFDKIIWPTITKAPREIDVN